MSVIYKFRLTHDYKASAEDSPYYLEAEVPASFDLLDLDLVDGEWYIWGWVSEKQEELKNKMRFVMIMTGESCKGRIHSSFYRRIKNGPFVAHIFFKERIYV